MKKRVLAGILAVTMLLSLTACGEGKNVGGTAKRTPLESDKELVLVVDDGADKELANIQVSDFAVKLFQSSYKGKTEDNLLISPISVYIALAMTTQGAKGETLAQMEETLGLNLGQMNAFCQEYMNNLPVDEAYKLAIANSIWYNADGAFTINDEFVAINKSFYNPELFQETFDESLVGKVNGWVDEKTEGLIKEILSEVNPDAVMYLINALVFDAKWAEIYEETQVYEDVFNGTSGKQKVQMMRSSEYKYISDDNASGFIKYYEGQRYAFVGLLPKEGIALSDYIAGLSGEGLQKMLSNPTEVTTIVTMPKFKTSSDIKLNDILKGMGMKDVFDKDLADLSGMGAAGGRLYVGNVLHKTYMEVGEQGTKAGAVTSVEVDCESAPMIQEIKEVHLDRPYVYMIIDCETNQPVFIGAMENCQ